ncbi:MAG: ABC transporter ATP-binding protein [Spirochaetales bacterium]|nr:ABC transporter ATP-binding protein [Spirochaetales bacterium]
MIELANVSKSYHRGAVRAVSNLSLSVKKGELFCLLGQNGAGKTTTQKLVAGVIAPDSGSILIQDIDLVAEPLKAKALIGYIPEEPVFYENMSGLQFLGFIADMYRVSGDARKRTGELIEMFGVQEYIREQISLYPYGVRQKISVISALLHAPTVMLLDEPLNGLDPQSSRMFQETLRSCVKNGCTVILSTYMMHVAEKLGDRVGILKKGELVENTTLRGLKRKSGDKNANLEDIFLEITQ